VNIFSIFLIFSEEQDVAKSSANSVESVDVFI
jgi:hypothetical protein